MLHSGSCAELTSCGSDLSHMLELSKKRLFCIVGSHESSHIQMHPFDIEIIQDATSFWASVDLPSGGVR